ncbi:MAG: DNA helicase RecQ, partial [Thermoanaerobaculia bacterium]
MQEQLLDVIARHWGYRTFRPLQEEAMLAVLDARDTVVVMPTGGGKSLCYQVPALLRPGLTVVVSPLISLMKDQVDGLRANGVAASMMNSSQSSGEHRELEGELAKGKVRLLFVSPERLAMPSFRQSLVRAGVTAFAIDEAHCISHWGHDFRPEYRQLRNLRGQFPEASFHAYTATATEPVRADIAQQLALHDPLVLVGDFDRPNLTYRVLPRIDEVPQLVEVLERHKGEAGIVYCVRRKDVDALTAVLKKRGYNALAYHAGMPQEERRKAQEAFSQERCDIVVATVAFGMGIDRSNVRFVVHMAMPKSIEHYQQESGRAGRDGLAAECLMLYSGADAALWRSMIERGSAEIDPDPKFVESANRHLSDIDRYASGTICRHRALVQYFGQSWSGGSCDACDVCLGETEDVPGALVVAQKIVSCVYRLQQSWGAAHVVSVLRGENTEKIRSRNHDALSTYGLLKGHGRNELRDWIYQLVSQGFLLQTTGDTFPVLHLTETSRDVLRGEAEVTLRQPLVARKESAAPRKRSRTMPEGPYDRDLFERLRTWRRSEAQERGVPPYVIFSDRTLQEVARTSPQSMAALRQLYGIGEAKLEA